jgi:hypothetical protein
MGAIRIVFSKVPPIGCIWDHYECCVAAYPKAMNHCRICMERCGNMECMVVRSKWQLHVKFTYDCSVSSVSESYTIRPPTETVSTVGTKRMYVFLLLSGEVVVAIVMRAWSVIVCLATQQQFLILESEISSEAFILPFHLASLGFTDIL